MTLNGLRHVALTPTVTKVFERLVLNDTKVVTDEFLDPFPFAFRTKISLMILLYMLLTVCMHI